MQIACMAKRVCKDFEIKKLGEYHDLYLKNDTLLLSDIFENFRQIYLNIYHLDPPITFSVPGLAWQAALKRTEVKLELLTDIDMLLMVVKWSEEGICHTIHRYIKANNRYMKDYDKNKESSYLKYLDVNNLYGWAMSEKLSANSFEWIEKTFQFNEGFMKSYTKESDKIGINYRGNISQSWYFVSWKITLNSQNYLPFLPERMKIKKKNNRKT